jgi:dephospho-CoA kinase
MLAARGAHVIDADVLARLALRRGGPGYSKVRESFGVDVIARDGNLDREALARLVFSDESARRRLEAIVHPSVEASIRAELALLGEGAGVAVLDVALLVETDGRRRYQLDGVLVVDSPEELCVERLVAHRSMTEAAARARLGAQIAREERLRAADFIIMNLASLEELEEMVARAWTWIESLAESTAH